jgi:demethylmenaquinone methyltransferase/2-methoxy-6-polyprenyl-1,4-benzoquinol methylase
VLEIGFGTGHALGELAQGVGTSGLAAGVELSPGMVRVARQRLRAEGSKRCAQLTRGDGTQLPFAGEAFDALFLSFTLELFDDPEIPVLLGECRRVLKSSGRLGVVSLAKQNTLACHLYEWGHAHWPFLLDCRPVLAQIYLKAAGFQILNSRLRTMWGLPVEITLASR